MEKRGGSGQSQLSTQIGWLNYEMGQMELVSP